MMRGLIILFACLLSANALAQSSPGLVYGQKPTAQQWNSYFSAKQDVFGYVPLNKAGDAATGPILMPQFISNSGTPGASTGAGAGGSPSLVLVNAHDNGFDINLTTGSSPNGSNANIVVVTFSAVYPTAPHCSFSPLNPAAGALASAVQPSESINASSWTLVSGATGLAASTQYQWSVICQG